MQNNSLITVVMPVYNGERYLAEAINSVLAQTYRLIEIIVVDDGSTDGSADIVKRYNSPVRYFFQENRGLGAALNQGVALSRGNFFAFLDADDLWIKDKLSLQMAVLESNQNPDMVFGYVRSFISPELKGNSRKTAACPHDPMPGYCKGAMLVRRESFARVGPFSTDWHVGDFVDWYSRATEKGLKSLMMPEVVLLRRIHSANQGIRDRNYQTEYVHILKAALDRRRLKDV